MKKLLSTLIVLIPLVLIIALFAVTNTANISKDIAVTNIAILNQGDEGVFDIDLANYNSTNLLYIEDLQIEVYPKKAKNKNYNFSFCDPITLEKVDFVKIVDNHFEFSDIGQVKLIVTTEDGQFSSSVLLNITSSMPLRATPIIKNSALDEIELHKIDDNNYYAYCPTGNYTISSLAYPSNIKNYNYSFSSSSENIELNSHFGDFTILYSGESTITCKTETISGEQNINVTLYSSLNTSDFAINGIESGNLVIPKGNDAYSFYLESSASIESIHFASSQITNYDIDKINDKVALVSLDFESSELDQIAYELYINGISKGIFNATFVEVDFKIITSRQTIDSTNYYQFNESVLKYAVSSNPKHIDYSYTIELSNDNFEISSKQDNYFVLKANNNGDCILKVVVQYKNTTYILEKNLHSINYFSSIAFKENATTYGLQNKLAIASSIVQENQINNVSYTSKFSFKGNDNLEISSNDFTIISTDDNIASASIQSNSLVIKVKETGSVTIKVKWNFGDLETALTFQAVKGITASTYKDLVFAQDNNLQIVLNNDISLGEYLFEDNGNSRSAKYSNQEMLQKLRNETREIKTTYDWTYYKNLGMSQPSVRYCLEFTNNVYGNGYTIDADNITNMFDSTGNLYSYAVFNGPLDFVATSSDGIKIASVKAQDNIVFLVRNKNVSLNNVVLKSFKDSTLYEEDSINLSLLNYAGTTLEVMNNTNINYCRISNGRTVLRAFGKETNSEIINPNTERMKVGINNSILSNAREFILKVGTNRFLKSTSNLAPSLYDQNANPYTFNNSLENDKLVSDSYFYNNYVLTDVTVNNTTFKNSGLFCIGIDSHFAGAMLNGDESLSSAFRLEGWKDLAGTSYPAIVRLQGNVLFDDEKEVESIDSSTLIETNTSKESLSFLNLDIKSMIKYAKNSDLEKYADLFVEKDGKNLINPAVAFYGGGKNYSIIDLTDLNNKNYNHYNINLSILEDAEDNNLSSQGKYLPLAAGVEDFRFIMINID